VTGFGIDLANRLIAANIVTALGTDVSVGQKAKIPTGDGVITIVESGGSGTTERHDRVGDPYENPSALIVARHSKASLAKDQAASAFKLLCAIRNQEIGGAFYLWIRPVQSPFDLGVDDIGRSRWAFNVNARKTLT
jgi:hypothetical protein